MESFSLTSLSRFTFALMKTGVFNQNVGKLFSEFKLITFSLFIRFCTIDSTYTGSLLCTVI